MSITIRVRATELLSSGMKDRLLSRLRTECEVEVKAALARIADPPTNAVHLVLKPDWPIALCGHSVEKLLGTRAPGRDRCTECLRIAAARKLGSSGWCSAEASQ